MIKSAFIVITVYSAIGGSLAFAEDLEHSPLAMVGVAFIWCWVGGWFAARRDHKAKLDRWLTTAGNTAVMGAGIVLAAYVWYEFDHRIGWLACALSAILSTLGLRFVDAAGTQIMDRWDGRKK